MNAATTEQTISNLTPATLSTLKKYADHSLDWSGWALPAWVSSGNIKPTKEMRGNLSDLIKKNIIEIWDWETSNRAEDMVYAFTDLGLEICKHLAAKGEIIQDSQHE